MKFGIDLGHGVGEDRGAVSFIAEETVINAVGRLIIKKLKDLGHEVIELRPASALSVNHSLEQRYSKADYYNVDLCVSIHANAGGGKGTEVYTYKAKPVPQAKQVLNNLTSLGFVNRGIKDGSKLAMVRKPKSTAMLIEILFIDSNVDRDLYKSIGVVKIADAIVKGLINQTMETDNKKYYVVTEYLPIAYSGYNGVDIKYIIDKYFSSIKTYVRWNAKGIWLETQYLTLEQCNNLKSSLGDLYYSIENK